MMEQFNNYILQNSLFNADDKILLTVSGGIDSSVMTYLFHQSGFKFAIAHCNFQLRGVDSDLDEAFVKTMAEKYKVRFFSERFDTKEYAAQNKISIQMAARDLRYNWFEKLLEKYGFNYIATAHHRDDEIETFFINVLRGTGISGLQGISNKKGNIIRPLLFATRPEIEEFALRNSIEYREDITNSSTKYIRNSIRHQVIPVLKKINPSLNETMSDIFRNLKSVDTIFLHTIEEQKKRIVLKKTDETLIEIKELAALPSYETFLYEFIKEYGFNPSIISDIKNSMFNESGRQFFSNTHRIIKDRDFLVITEKKPDEKELYEIHEHVPNINKPVYLSFEILKNADDINLRVSQNIAMIDYEKLTFPLTIRHWMEGDIFYPFGLNFKKKLSDYFIDRKFSLNTKENAWLLCTGNKIVWIIGERTDNRFRVTEITRKILKITC